MKPGSAAITAPKPYSEAVFIDASRAPPIADLLPSANFSFSWRNANANTSRMPTSSAPSTAQIATTGVTSTVSGLAMPGNATS